MAQALKSLLCKHGNLSTSPRIHGEKAANNGGIHSYGIHWAGETVGSLELAGWLVQLKFSVVRGQLLRVVSGLYRHSH